MPLTRSRHYDRCCNPFQLKNHKRRLGLRQVSQRLRKKWKLGRNDYVCPQCRIKMNKTRSPTPALAPAPPSADAFATEVVNDFIIESDGDFSRYTSKESQLSVNTTLPVINTAIELLGVSPIPKKRLRMSTETYIVQKVDKVCHNLKQSLGGTNESNLVTKEDAQDLMRMIYELKKKLHNSETSRVEKLQILTLMPPNWSKAKVMRIMNVSKNLVKQARKLLKTDGILAMPGKKLGRSIAKDTKNTVVKFYHDDRVSANMPGMKDYISMRTPEGGRSHIQKRLLLANLKEVYKFFQTECPDAKIGFSSFAALRPKNCILAGASGTHTVCVCPIHQNVKLMMLGCDLKRLTNHLEYPLKQYNNCQDLMICENPTEDCFFANCDDCPGYTVLQDLILDVLEHNDIERITYKQWVSKPRATLETFVKCATEFAEDFCTKMQSLLPHSFIAKEQASFMKTLKESLGTNEFLVICDFAENYTFVIQDAVPAFHWNNNQSTVYPTVIYYKKDNLIEHRSLVVISDCLAHDSIAVHVYSEIINLFIRTISEDPAKLYYFSDGAPQQFKNLKNFANICHHEKDYGVPAEWHFFATAHGKGPCDGVGGTVKRLAARASLQLAPDRQITTPHELYQWASVPTNLPNIAVKFSPQERYDDAKAILAPRFERAKPIPGTQKIHCEIPQANGSLKVKRYSSSMSYAIHRSEK